MRRHVEHHEELTQEKIKNDHVKVIDLASPLEPKDIYEGIPCRTSATVFIETILCVHDPKKDLYVSKSIWENGIWERSIITSFMTYVNKYPDWLVFDIGGNLGQFSLFASKMGRTVVTAEPFHDNILRIHKAAKLAHVEKRITLVKNAIGSERNKIMRLSPDNGNVGAQTLMYNKNKNFTEDSSDKYLVETVWFDDLIDYLPKKENGQDFDQAILKIDIEGFEPYAFTHATKLFQTIQFNVVFMEFKNWFLNRYVESRIVENMLDILSKHKLTAYNSKGDSLKIEEWKSWDVGQTGDIVWKRDGF